MENEKQLGQNPGPKGQNLGHRESHQGCRTRGYSRNWPHVPSWMPYHYGTLIALCPVLPLYERACLCTPAPALCVSVCMGGGRGCVCVHKSLFIHRRTSDWEDTDLRNQTQGGLPAPSPEICNLQPKLNDIMGWGFWRLWKGLAHFACGKNINNLWPQGRLWQVKDGTSSLTFLPLISGESVSLHLNLIRFCDAFEQPNMVKVKLQQFLNPGFRRFTTFTSCFWAARHQPVVEKYDYPDTTMLWEA